MWVRQRCRGRRRPRSDAEGLPFAAVLLLVLSLCLVGKTLSREIEREEDVEHYIEDLEHDHNGPDRGLEDRGNAERHLPPPTPAPQPVVRPADCNSPRIVQPRLRAIFRLLGRRKRARHELRGHCCPECESGLAELRPAWYRTCTNSRGALKGEHTGRTSARARTWLRSVHSRGPRQICEWSADYGEWHPQDGRRVPMMEVLQRLSAKLNLIEQTRGDNSICLDDADAGTRRSSLHRLSTIAEGLWTHVDEPSGRQESYSDADLQWLFPELEERFEFDLLRVGRVSLQDRAVPILKAVRQAIRREQQQRLEGFCPAPAFADHVRAGRSRYTRLVSFSEVDQFTLWLARIRNKARRMAVDARKLRARATGWSKRVLSEGARSRRPRETRAAPKPDREETSALSLRTNFASDDLGARIVDVSQGTVGASNVLRRDADRYMLAPCRTNLRHIVIELSQEIVVEVVEIANREYYSSSPQQVMLLGAGQFPSKEWHKLGIFGFNEGSSRQALRLLRPSIARYLKIVLIGSQSAAYYCTLTEVRVYGKTLIDDWKEEMDQSESLTHSSTLEISRRPNLADLFDQQGISGMLNLNHDLSRVVGYENVFRRVTRSLRWLQFNQTRLESWASSQLEQLQKELKSVRYDAAISKREAIAASEMAWAMSTHLQREVEVSRRVAAWALGTALFSTSILLLIVAFQARKVLRETAVAVGKAMEMPRPVTNGNSNGNGNGNGNGNSNSNSSRRQANGAVTSNFGKRVLNRAKSKVKRADSAKNVVEGIQKPSCPPRPPVRPLPRGEHASLSGDLPDPPKRSVSLKTAAMKRRTRNSFTLLSVANDS